MSNLPRTEVMFDGDHPRDFEANIGFIVTGAVTCWGAGFSQAGAILKDMPALP